MSDRAIDAPHRCTKCKKWLPETEFPWSYYPALKGGGRKRKKFSVCRHCLYEKQQKNLQQRCKYMIRRAKLRAAVSPDCGYEYLMELFKKQSGMCALTGKKMTFRANVGFVGTNLSLDRIKPNLPYTRDNVRLVCRRVNSMKSDMSDNELVSWCRSILRKRRKGK